MYAVNKTAGGSSMASPIHFEIREGKGTFLDPRKGFEPFTEKFQVRVDPLTGRTGHFSHFGAIKPQKLDLDYYRRPEVKGFCPFCPETRDKVTPKFPEHVMVEGRARKNEALLIPNLYPYDEYSGVIIMTDEHVAPLDELTERRLTDTFALGVEFLKKARAHNEAPPYPVITWNYMPPSGGGLVHPHQQCFATSYPGNQYMDELRASERFYAKQRMNYWSALVDEEQRIGKRYMGSLGSSHWLASFVSLGILGEVMGVFPDVFSIDDFAETHTQALVSGLLRVFSYYRANDIYSFNAALFFGPPEQNYFATHFRIIPRTFLNMRDFASDSNFLQMLLGEPVSVVMPEDVCDAAKQHFR
jgi:UDPglucose--hexose-1-phosphate uridylyltransferase